MKQFDSRCHSQQVRVGQQNSTHFFGEKDSEVKINKKGHNFLRAGADTHFTMLQIFKRKPPPALQPAAPLPAFPLRASTPRPGPRARSRLILNVPKPRVVARLAALAGYLPAADFKIASWLVDYLPDRAFHHLDLDKALMTLKNDLTENHRHVKTGVVLDVAFADSKKGRKQVDLCLDRILRVLFDDDFVARVYRASNGCFDSHLKPRP